MAIDPVQLVDMARPKPAEAASSFVPQKGAMRRMRDTLVEDHEGNARSLAELATSPGSPTYAEKIPNPPCFQCGADHNPIATAQGKYDHPYRRMEESTDRFVGPGVPAPPVADPGIPVPPPNPVSATAAKRLSIFPGRQDDTYVLIVERREGDDWEDDQSNRASGDELALFLRVLDALDVKIKDRTGGDLVGLRQRERKPA